MSARRHLWLAFGGFVLYSAAVLAGAGWLASTGRAPATLCWAGAAFLLIALAVRPRGLPVDVLSLADACPALGERVTVHLSILDHDDLRGALKPDAGGRTERGDAQALRRLMELSDD